MSKKLFFVGEQVLFMYGALDINGVAITPVSGTIDIKDTDGNAIVTGAALAISGDNVTYLYTVGAVGEYVAYFKVQLPNSKPTFRDTFRVIAADGVSQ